MSDEVIVRATIDLVQEFGPGVTLAQVGDRVGLSPATVVQRFGTRRTLLLQTVTMWMEVLLPPIGLTEDGVLDRIVDVFAKTSALVGDPSRLANSGATLYLQLNDPEFRRILQVGMGRHRDSIKEAFDAALEAGELKPCDTRMLAESFHAMGYGAMQSWAVHPNGSLEDWVRRRLLFLVDPLRA